MYIPSGVELTSETSVTSGELCAARTRRIIINGKTKQPLKPLKTSMVVKAVNQLHLKWQLVKLALPISAFC